MEFFFPRSAAKLKFAGCMKLAYFQALQQSGIPQRRIVHSESLGLKGLPWALKSLRASLLSSLWGI